MEKKNKKNKSKFYNFQIICGENINQKLIKLVLFKKKKSDYLFITASENNAWLLNIRGHDTNYTPYPYSYILIDKNKNIKFFCDLKKISISLRKYFKKLNF